MRSRHWREFHRSSRRTEESMYSWYLCDELVSIASPLLGVCLYLESRFAADSLTSITDNRVITGKPNLVRLLEKSGCFFLLLALPLSRTWSQIMRLRFPVKLTLFGRSYVVIVSLLYVNLISWIAALSSLPTLSREKCLLSVQLPGLLVLVF